LLERIHLVAAGRSHPVEMRSHEGNVTHDTNPSQAEMFNELFKKFALAAAYRTC
jgi:hypothetical protein